MNTRYIKDKEVSWSEAFQLLSAGEIIMRGEVLYQVRNGRLERSDSEGCWRPTDMLLSVFRQVCWSSTRREALPVPLLVALTDMLQHPAKRYTDSDGRIYRVPEFWVELQIRVDDAWRICPVRPAELTEVVCQTS